MNNDVDAFIDRCVASMDESKRGLTRPMLEQFVWYNVQILELQKQIEEEGALIEVERGSANHQYTAWVENPASKVISRFTTQAGNHYAKLMRFLTKAEMEQVDALEDFLKNG